MVNKPKAIGTAAESAVVKYLLSIGYDKTTVMRKTLSGASDIGDVWCHHSDGTIIIEVKGGEAARTASHAQIEAWLAEAAREKANAALDTRVTPVLVTQRRGVGVGRAGDWTLWIDSNDLLGSVYDPKHPSYPISMRLRDFMSEFTPKPPPSLFDSIAALPVVELLGSTPRALSAP